MPDAHPRHRRLVTNAHARPPFGVEHGPGFGDEAVGVKRRWQDATWLRSAAAPVALAVLAACGSAGAERRAVSGPDPVTELFTSLDVLPETTTTSAPVTTTTTEALPEAPADDARSTGVRAVQVRLAALGYDVGVPDGGLGDRTAHALMSFQKVEGLPRTAAIDDATVAALDTASTPGPMVPDGAATRIEIDLDRQVLLLWKGGSLARILNASTGSGEHYCVDGECDVAVTRPGAFRIGRKFDGMEVSRLGRLYHPMYFDGGIAIHGSPSVPAHPASHGCVRIPMYASGSFHTQVAGGTWVYVVGTPAGDVPAAPPPDEPTVQIADPEPEPPTTTTAPPATTTTEPAPTTTSSSSTTTPGG
jgi:hypothetical protein